MQTAHAHVITPFRRRPIERAIENEYTFADMVELCLFLKTEIAASKKKYSWIAERAGVCGSTVANLAHGQTQFPRAGTVFQVLHALGFELVARR